MITIGMVVEGSHDYLMLKPLISAELNRRGVEDVGFRNLQPAQDATGYFPDGGWTRVVAWCLDNSEDGFLGVFQPAVAGDRELDLVVIHLDGDAAQLIAPHAAINPPSPLTCVARVQYIAAAIEGWLSLSRVARSKLVIAVPVQQTEAWMNAADQSDNSGTWEVGDSKALLRGRWDKAKHGNLAGHYESEGERAAESADLIAQRCRSYGAFRAEVGGANL